MAKNFAIRTAVWTAIALLLLVVVGLLFPGRGPQKNGCQLQSISQMQMIAACVAHYRRNHGGRFPEHLSGLVPGSVQDIEIFYFSCRYGRTFTPPNAYSEPKLIDAFSPYSLLRLADGRALVFERVPMWSDSTIGYCLVPPNMDAVEPIQGSRLPREEFARRYVLGFTP